MRNRHIVGIVLVVVIGSITALFLLRQKETFVSPLAKQALNVLKPLDKYTFDNLKNRTYSASSITFGKKLKETPQYVSYVFFFTADPSTGSGKGKKVSGLASIPKAQGAYPVIVMFRGFVDQKIYTIGEGTRHSAEVFAQNGFITLAPDFLGYGESDKPSDDSIEERFQTYTTALSLLASIKNLNSSLKTIEGIESTADDSKIGMWGHSNGGHIALSVLAISQKKYPTVLWNPVSKPFPYSVLYFTDDFDDHGKALLQVIAHFWKEYDAEKYSPPNYYQWIQAPIQLHQAIEDEAVPLKWSNQLNDQLVHLKKDVAYYVYPGEDHNFSKGSWPTAIQRSINFYNENSLKP